MERDAPAATDATSAADAAPIEPTPVSDASVTEGADDSGVSAVQGAEATENEPQESTTDQRLDGGDDVSKPLPQGDQGEESEPLNAEAEEAPSAEADGQQDDVVMASDPANAPSSDAATAAEAEDAAASDADQAGEQVTGNDSDEKDEALDASPKEALAATEDAVKDDASISDHQENVPASAPDDGADNSSPVEPSCVSMEIKAALSDEQEAGKDAPVESTQADAASSPPAAHDESEYGPSAPALAVDAVPHGEDEYDPANPSPAGTPMASNRPASEQEEYDPDHPSMTSSAAVEGPVAMEVDGTLASDVPGEQSTVTPAKRKADDEPNASSNAPANGDADPKRPRYVEDSKGSSHDDDQKHGRHRRGSGDSTASSTSRHKHHEEDHKGLSAAAWDRLMDFQTSGEFRVTQVSRAAFASVGAMPGFAQIAIIARFVRTPMRDIRDKNGQLMRIYREYQKENPQVAALQPVDAFISDYKSDPGLFRFGYAPPQPATGVSTVQVPYQRDQPQEDTSVTNSPRPARARPEPERHQQKDVDEFGRAVHSEKATAPETNGSTRTTNPRAAVDPRLTSRSRQGPPSPTAQPMPRAATGTRAEDPRRRDQPLPQSRSGAGRDPRRRVSLMNQQPSPRGAQPGPPSAAGSNGMYERLPPPVKAVVDSMRREGRLQEPLNDNVVTRLLHLPERVALQAVENFSNVDLSQVENLQGFLVGIINRVNEKAIASEKQNRPQVPSPRGQPPSAMPRGGAYGAPAQGASVLGGPPQGGRLNSNGANGGGYPPMTAGPGPALFDRPYEAPQDPRDPRRRQPAPQGQAQYGGAARGPPAFAAARAPVGMQSFTVLPVSVQNHVHSLVANQTLSSLEELGGKCYEVLGQLSEPLANQVLTRFAGANLSNVRNKSGFLVGVVKRARQEYGFN
ncbi:hypothetical protein PHYPSEUDO_002902 [Phytophthora pseudosyringae]|uniref:Heterogeneous nuclear ribonucleoprotein Q acidic domain-containing protein n=1 Tax=Phytophthora pseudosyringae TaxID=221518 RepID=A0A8T1VXB8_9STRA|nr:hypothetical protein PHYPSEUDO_002902 [Phytophthora pseudosyringae]